MTPSRTTASSAAASRTAAARTAASRATRRAPRPVVVPGYAAELDLAAALGGTGVVVGLDEVGRGALAGPVVVGACAIRIEDGRVLTDLPAEVRDSKALTARRRETLVDPIGAAAHAHALGWSSAAEIDERGIMGALTLAALRAIEGLGTAVHAVLLDGNVDVIGPHLRPGADGSVPRVGLRVGADRECRSVAAASVIAKVARDRHMVALAADAPDYRWDANKGYAAAAHREALRRLGPHPLHRRSWNLLGAPAAPAAARAQTPDVLWSADDETGPRGRNHGHGQQEDAR